MTENLSQTGIILEILGDLELPLLTPVVKTEDGYEVMLTLPKQKRLSKDLLKQELENRKLKVMDIDVFREKTNHYAWTIVIPSESETENG